MTMREGTTEQNVDWRLLLHTPQRTAAGSRFSRALGNESATLSLPTYEEAWEMSVLTVTQEKQ